MIAERIAPEGIPPEGDSDPPHEPQGVALVAEKSKKKQKGYKVIL